MSSDPVPESPAGWQSVRDAVMARIRARTYAPGALIPNEADLAVEFGVARATVNRALRALADEGFLERRRKAGTRVASAPVRKAVLPIPLTRAEVEATGAVYSFELLLRETAVPPPDVAEALGTGPRALLHLVTLHRGGAQPAVLEDRWVDLVTAPGLAEIDLTAVNPNEWLVHNLPYTHGTMAFSAQAAGARAQALDCAPGDSIMVLTRATWLEDAPITHVRQCFPPGRNLTLQL
ncbi:UTRA domain-containing protein [Paracoccus suum]|uniref:UTRA domain-containing protein n=1 Tax=Paracoccus suum TaxID=2259340 RepID=A0A344PI18_9RHOB|nr:GntR family transcriptional regulator [Paracoccus suum]AXC49023.1 UTRA domain-containing protein [Paracoccus suum]